MITSLLLLQLLLQLSLHPLAELMTNNTCTYSNNNLTDISINKQIGSIQIKNIMEVSFDLRINHPIACNSGLYCHIFAIGHNDQAGYGRFPLIYTQGSNLAASFMTNNGNIDTNIPASTTITDGDWHNLYFKFTLTNKIIKIDNIIYANISDISFNYSNYINITTDINAVWGNPSVSQYVHDGMLRNICVTSMYNTVYPSPSPTSNPSTIYPSSSPTANPSTIYPSSSPTSNPSTFSTIYPSSLPTANPSTIYPSSSPTANPSTIYPSSLPTANPSTIYPTSLSRTLSPTVSPPLQSFVMTNATIFCEEFEQIISIKFSYMVSNDSATPSDTEIKSRILKEADILIKNVSDSICIINHYNSNVTLINNKQQAVLNTYICSECQLTKQIQKIRNILVSIDNQQNSQDPILIVIANISSIYVEIVNKKIVTTQNNMAIDTYTTGIINIFNDNKMDETSFWIIIVVLMSFICICCLILAVIVTKKIQRDKKIETKDKIQLTMMDHPKMECKVNNHDLVDPYYRDKIVNPHPDDVDTGSMTDKIIPTVSGDLLNNDEFIIDNKDEFVTPNNRNNIDRNDNKKEGIIDIQSKGNNDKTVIEDDMSNEGNQHHFIKNCKVTKGDDVFGNSMNQKC